jgi:hypothetical protein
LPTVHKEKGFRFFFYSTDHTPSHVHVSKGRSEAKLELATGKIIDPGRFRDHDLREIQRILVANRLKIQKQWDTLVERRGYN